MSRLQVMSAPPGWPAIDWQQPWLESLRAVGAPLAAQIERGMPVYQALNAVRPAPLLQVGLRFVAQTALPLGCAYETFIRQERAVPTRDHVHDFFNGLIWLQWPQLKLHLNALQAQEIARTGVQQRRGPLRDAITVLDENGAFWLAPQALIAALRARDWHRLMVTLRPLWSHSRLLPVGHALLEKLLLPRKPVTAHVLCLPLDGDEGRSWSHGVLQALAGASTTTAWDAVLAPSAVCSAPSLAAKPFNPLPVLGVPGWWAENTNFSFYDDSLVFRGQRPTNTNSTMGPAEVTTA